MQFSIFTILIFYQTVTLSIPQFTEQYQGSSSRLTRHLLEKHNKCSPPDGRVDISHNIELVHIIGINELNQNMQVLVYIIQVNFVMRLEHKMLLDAVRSPIKVSYIGEVTYAYPAIYTVLCQIGIANFPFDDQVCKIRFASWAYDEDKILLNASHKPLLKNYAPNEEWALQDVNMARKEYEHEETVVSEIIYYIKVARKPFYYLISLVVPSYIICVLSIAGLFARFSTKHERQERFTLGVTAILSMAVLSLVVTEKVPHSSESVPLLIVYMHFIIIMVTIATILTSTVMRVHAKGFRTHFLSPPNWIRKGLFIARKHAAFFQQNVSRRMDYLLASVFIIIISTPTLYLFYMCFQMDHAAAERILLENAKRRDQLYY
ncbi:Protein CBR-PBO-6 [Caenorhabditis briggsae]|uniref:Protein CBR-PBO-6 n=1 Tax=Caenorhabditis briggsae TaxID=6238 RepID=A8XNG3_CAEBR|nr:Protein CBR-PBO-6 [Caenorhabditis briggsae]CAP34394.2 Protein CBR-PBO-6 [Caenorhabditis briggsae]